jgi:hypothetical protein
MQLNISHEVTTTETKTVDVELPFFSKGAMTPNALSKDYFFCINENKDVLKVYNQRGYTSFQCAVAEGPAVEVYADLLQAAIEGEVISRAEFEYQFNTVLSFTI